jgi:hypothetical protein
MANENSQPSVNPADEDSLAGLMRLVMTKTMQSMDGRMPARVIAYDRATNRATLQPVIKMVGTDGREVARAPVASVRVYQFGNGRFSLSLPIKEGDLGWLHAGDRDTSAFLQDHKDGPPNTARMHSFQDGVFYPDAMKYGNVGATDGERAVFATGDNGSSIAFDESGIYLTVGGNVLSLTSAGLHMNGKNIGDTHTHGGITPGGSNTAVPNV